MSLRKRRCFFVVGISRISGVVTTVFYYYKNVAIKGFLITLFETIYKICIKSMKIILVIVVILVVVIIGYLFVFPGHYNGKEHLVSFSNVKLSKPILSNSGVIIE